jgi:hypothetical protein
MSETLRRERAPEVLNAGVDDQDRGVERMIALFSK